MYLCQILIYQWKKLLDLKFKNIPSIMISSIATTLKTGLKYLLK